MEELATTLSREDMFKILVTEPMKGALEVDWRDFFPYLRWIPNKSMEMRIKQMCLRKNAVMKALIGQEKKRIERGEVTFPCFTTMQNAFLKETRVLQLALTDLSEISNRKKIVSCIICYLKQKH